jgi:hypothetical protein
MISGVKTQGISQYFNNFSKAKEVFLRSIPQLPPEFILVQEKPFPTNLPPTYKTITGYHGTNLASVKEQIESGMLEDRQEPFFIASMPFVSEYYAKRAVKKAKKRSKTPSSPLDKPVVLKICFNQNLLARMVFFPSLLCIAPGKGERAAYIINVFEENPEYNKAISPENIHKYLPPLKIRLREIHKIACESFSRQLPKSFS